MELYLLEKLEMILTRCSGSLHLRDWSGQGASFYSGTVTYSAKLNGWQLGRRVWKPYEYILDLDQGRNYLEITVSNTLANLLECYRAESGIPLPGKIPGIQDIFRPDEKSISVLEF